MVNWTDVQKILNQEIIPIREFENIPIFSSLNRISSSEVLSTISIPQFNRSLVDGYAISRSISASSNRWKIIGESKIGIQPEYGNLDLSQAIYTPTGSILPDGCIAVIKIEDSIIRIENNLKFVEIGDIPERGTNVEYTGSDVALNNILVRKNDIIDPQKISLLSAAGIKEITVYKKPRFSIIVTGHEIISPGEPLNIGQVYDSTSALLISLINSFGGVVTGLYKTGESEEEIIKKISISIQASDIILTTGGTSVGKSDNVVKAVENLGEVIFHGINVRPGKPVLFGKIQKIPIIGFPGFVTSSAVIASLFFPIIFGKIFNLNKINQETILCKTTKRIKAFKGWYRIIPGFAENNVFSPTFKTSSAITSYSDSNGYVILNPTDEDVPINAEVLFTYYKAGLN
ncbi:MAG: molybdopterin molybdotransferase MoeA [Candidatus Hodarchaeales archaeon]